MDLASIVSSPTVQLSLVIVLIGVGIRTWSGLIGKSAFDINLNTVLFTFVMAILTSMQIVRPILEQIPDDATPEVWFTAVIGGILTVIGTDAVGRKAVNTVAKKTVV